MVSRWKGRKISEKAAYTAHELLIGKEDVGQVSKDADERDLDQFSARFSYTGLSRYPIGQHYLHLISGELEHASNVFVIRIGWREENAGRMCYDLASSGRVMRIVDYSRKRNIRIESLSLWFPFRPFHPDGEARFYNVKKATTSLISILFR